MDKEEALGKIREQIRKGIHYNCTCKGCEELRLLLDFLVGIDLIKEDFEEIRQIIHNTENRPIEFADSLNKIKEIIND